MSGLNAKFLYVDTNGNYAEASAAITSSAGAGDAGKLVQTNASGKIDASLINFSAFNKVYSARVASTANIALSAPGATIDGVTLSNGDRFLAKNQTTQAENGIYVFNGAAVAATRASDWDEASEIKAGDIVVAEEGTTNDNKVYILTTNNPIVVGTTALTFADIGTQIVGAGNGLSYSGTDLNVNAGDGIQILSDNVAAKVSDFAGLGLEDDGSNNLAIDFANPASEMGTSRAVKASDLSASGANQGAKILGFDNSAVTIYTAATNLQQAVEDAFSWATTPSVPFTVGTGGVAKADAVYISADDTVRKYATLSGSERVAGLAIANTAAAGTVRVLQDSAVLTGVLSGATAGAAYYWTGSGLSATIPSGSGSHVWRVGIAKNSTDLLVRIEFVKKNS
jgi:hypothetical protein